MPTTDRTKEVQEWINQVKADEAYTKNPAAWGTLFRYLEQEQAPLPAYDPLFDHWQAARLMQIFELPQNWTTFDRRLMTLHRHFWAAAKGTNVTYWKKESFLRFWPFDVWRQHRDQATFDRVLVILKEYGVEEDVIWNTLTESDLLQDEENTRLWPTERYVADRADAMLAKSPPNTIWWQRWALFPTLLQHNEPVLDKYLKSFIFIDPKGSDAGNFLAGQQYIAMLIKHNPIKYESFIAQFIQPIDRLSELEARREVLRVLQRFFPGKYDQAFYQYAKAYLEKLRKLVNASDFPYDWDEGEAFNYLHINRVFSAVLDQEPAATAIPFLQAYLRGMPVIFSQVVNFLYTRLGAASLPLLMEVLPKKPQNFDSGHHRLFEILPNIPHEAYYPTLWKNIRHSSATVRLLLSRHIGKVIGPAASAGGGPAERQEHKYAPKRGDYPQRYRHGSGGAHPACGAGYRAGRRGARPDFGESGRGIFTPDHPRGHCRRRAAGCATRQTRPTPCAVA